MEELEKISKRFDEQMKEVVKTIKKLKNFGKEIEKTNMEFVQRLRSLY